MATSSSFFTLRRGSTKSLTFQVYGGKQVTKDRVGKPANPQTTLQMRQRIKLAPVAQTRSLLKPIINHSFEGVNYGMESVRYFSKINLDANNNNVKFYGYSLPGWENISVANYQISKGSLTPLVYNVEHAAAYVHHVPGITAPEKAPETLEGIVDEIYRILGLADDDQLSFVYALPTGFAYEKEDGEATKNYFQLKWRVDRLKKNDPDIMSAWKFRLEDENYYITDGQIYLSVREGSPSNGYCVWIQTAPNNDGDDFYMFAAVASRPDGTTWKRSSQFCEVPNWITLPDATKLSSLVSEDEAIAALTKVAGSSRYLNSGGTGSIEMVPLPITVK